MKSGSLVNSISLWNEVLVKFLKYFFELLLILFISKLEGLKNVFSLLTHCVDEGADLDLRVVLVQFRRHSEARKSFPPVEPFRWVAEVKTFRGVEQRYDYVSASSDMVTVGLISLKSRF